MIYRDTVSGIFSLWLFFRCIHQKNELNYRKKKNDKEPDGKQQKRSLILERWQFEKYKACQGLIKGVAAEWTKYILSKLTIN